MKKALEQTRLEERFPEHDLRTKLGSDLDTDLQASELLAHSSRQLTRMHYRRERARWPLRPLVFHSTARRSEPSGGPRAFRESNFDYACGERSYLWGRRLCFFTMRAFEKWWAVLGSNQRPIG
jgi:hypothetical protein